MRGCGGGSFADFDHFGRGLCDLLEPAAAIEPASVNRDLDLVGIDAVAHAIAAHLDVDDIHVDRRRLIDFAGEADDRPLPPAA